MYSNSSTSKSALPLRAGLVLCIYTASIAAQALPFSKKSIKERKRGLSDD